MAMAMLVSTRLWLGGVIRTRHDQQLITCLLTLIGACAVVAPLLLVVDGLRSYVDVFRLAFRTCEHAGGRRAPRKVPWPDLGIGQVVKQYGGKRVVGVTRGVVQGATQTPGALAGADTGMPGAQHCLYRAVERHASGDRAAGRGTPSGSSATLFRLSL